MRWRRIPTLDGLEAYVPDSGEGRWTVIEAIDLNISAPVITESLIRRVAVARGEQLYRSHDLDHARRLWRPCGEEGRELNNVSNSEMLTKHERI